jgi:hypothetical protein
MMELANLMAGSGALRGVNHRTTAITGASIRLDWTCALTGNRESCDAAWAVNS